MKTYIIPASKKHTFSVTILFLLFFLVHINVALTYRGIFIAPSFPAFLFCIAIFLHQFQTGKFRSLLKLYTPVLFVLLSTVSISLLYGATIARVMSVAMLAYSLFMGFTLFVFLKSQDTNNVIIALRYFLAFLFIGSFLESYTQFSIVSDTVRETLHGWNGIYVADIRDQIFYGNIRPKLFTPEPSFLGISFSLSIILYVSLSYRHILRATLSAVVLCGSALIICKSPTILYGFVVCLIIIFSKLRVGRRSTYRETKRLFFIGLFGVLLVPILLNEVFETSELTYSLLGSASWQTRQVLPFYFSLDFLTNSFLFGSGFGGDDYLTIKISEFYEDIGIFNRYPWLIGLEAMHLVTNAFYYWLSQMGVMGTLIFTILLRQFCAGENIQHFWISTLCTIVIWHTFGSISSPHSWIPFFMFLWVLDERAALMSTHNVSSHLYIKKQSIIAH